MRWRFTLSCLFFLLIGSSSSLTQASHLGVGDAANEGCPCHAYSSATEIFLEGIPQRFESNATLNITLRIESDIELNEGNHSLLWRATDRVGNTGNTVSDTIRIDTSMPELVGWTVDPLTTDLIGIANISFSTYDLLSGVDESTVSLQYGFDSNGVGPNSRSIRTMA